jgi:uncharacterized protein (TIGR02466 family)
MIYNALNIFPTTIYVGEIENHDEFKKEFYGVYPKFQYEQTNGDLINTVSENQGNPLIHLEPNLDSLFAEICKHIKTYMQDVLSLKDIFDLIITKTWISRAQDVDHEIPLHIHSPSHLSFVYYVNIPENSHSLEFSNHNRPNHIFPTIFSDEDYINYQISMVKEYTDINCETFYISPKEGSVVVFPSKVPHRTKAVSSEFKGERLAITGDVTLILKEEYLSFSSGYIHEKYWKKYQ